MITRLIFIPRATDLLDIPVTLDGARIEIGTVRGVLGEPVEATDDEIREAVVEAWRREERA